MIRNQQPFLDHRNIQVLVYLGLIFSETQIIANISAQLQPFAIPYFTILYFIVSTAHLLFITVRYTYFIKKSVNLSLQMYEHIILPISVLLTVLLNRNTGLIAYKATAIILLGVQSLLVTIKIIYFGSVTQQLAQISTTIKLLRVIKFNLIVILPLIINQQLMFVLIMAACQILSTLVFFFKFTYQKCKFEYLLLVGIAVGLISAIQNTFEAILQLPYLFVGELISIYFYVDGDSFLKTILELKYMNNQKIAENKEDDDHLANFLFLRECTMPKTATICHSTASQSEAAVQMCAHIKKYKMAHKLSLQHPHQTDNPLLDYLEYSPQQKSIIFFDLIYERFKKSTNYDCFQLLVETALELDDINRALIIYHTYFQVYTMKSSFFEQCKYQILYQKIINYVDINELEKDQIKFIQFSDELRNLNLQIQSCIANEIKLIQYISDNDKKTTLFPITELTCRNETKATIARTISRCLQQSMYVFSNQFKFLFILYNLCIVKRLEGLKCNLSTYFLSGKAKEINLNRSATNLVVLSGFNQGEIVNSNENFKNNFLISLGNFGKNNISQFIPTDKQRAAHLVKMNQSMSFQSEVKGRHCDFECGLIIERPISTIKLKIIEQYIISTRIHYQHKEGLQYICELTKIQSDPQNQHLVLLKRDYDTYLSQEMKLRLINRYKVKQLQQQIELCQIQFNQQLLKNNNALIEDTLPAPFQTKARPIEQYMQLKFKIIQTKLIKQQSLQSVYKGSIFCFLELAMIISIIIMLMQSFIYLESSLSDLSFVMINQHNRVISSELVVNRIFIEEYIIDFLYKTSYVSSQICVSQGIANIYSYIYAKQLQDLENGFDRSADLLTSSGNYGILHQNILSRTTSTIPYLVNLKFTVSFIKYIKILKSNTFEWLAGLNDQKGLDYNFYQNDFPTIMKDNIIDYPNSLLSKMKNDQATYEDSLQQILNYLETLASVIIGLFVLGMIMLRLMDNCALIQYLKLVQSISEDSLTLRLKELKYSLEQIVKIRNTLIDRIQIESSQFIQIKRKKKPSQNVPLQQFIQRQLARNLNNQMEDSDLSHQQSQNVFSTSLQKQASNLPKSELLRVIIFQRHYIIIVVMILVGFLSLSSILFGMEKNKLAVLKSCGQASIQFGRIQQKYINLIAYDWLKVLSVSTPINMTKADLMYEDSIEYLMNSNYQNLITDTYSTELSNEILYGNVCNYFLNSSACQLYRNGIFNSGFAILLPFTIKQHLEIDSVSLNSSFYFENLCDKTWLFFEGVVSMTTQIPYLAMQTMYQQADNKIMSNLLYLGVVAVSLLFITLYSQYQRLKLENIVRYEILSLDTISNLYTINQFKPYFNQIYYS